MQNETVAQPVPAPVVAEKQKSKVTTLVLSEEECNILVNFLDSGIKSGGIPAAKAGLPLFDKINAAFHGV